MAFIDLRSDVKTRPSEAMRRAMAAAEVGDDLSREDPTVSRLQERAAELMGMEAALLVISGTMGNLVALLSHTRPGQKVIFERDAHLFNYEGGGMGRIAGLMGHPLPGVHGALDPADVERAIWDRTPHRAATGLVSLENTHNRAGGTCLGVEQTAAVAEVAHRHGVALHIDGARIFNAAVALGVPAADLARPADSVTFCLSKSLGAPLGSVLCGSAAFIEEARVSRQVVGGGMRQAGVIAAAGLVALEEELPRLHEDHAKARMLAEAIADLPGVRLDLATVQTNLVIFELDRPDMDANLFCARLEALGVLAGAVAERLVRFVTHRDVSTAQVEQACEAARTALRPA